MTTPKYTYVELQLEGTHTFPAGLRKEIKAAGGTYTACRGDQRIRFVNLPVAADVLIDRVVTGSGCKMVTMIARGMKGDRSLPSWVCVHHFYRNNPKRPWSFLEACVRKTLAEAAERGLVVENPVEPAPMVTVPPTTPVTAQHHMERALKALEDLARFVDIESSAGSKAHYCAVKSEIELALTKL